MAQENYGEDQDEDGRTLLTWASAIAVTVLVCAAIIVKIYVYQFGKFGLSDDPGAWGQTGDFIGGLINPIVGLGTVVLIFISIQIQRTELRATTRQLDNANKRSAKQNFEQSLFSWLATHRELLNGMQADVALERQNTQTFSGRKLLGAWYERSLKLDHWGVDNCFGPTSSQLEVDSRMRIQQEYLKGFIKTYEALFANNRSELDAYLRTLYRLFDWIDTHEDLNPSEKFHYAALVRAQLSWVELAFLFYNGLTEEGAPFRRFYERYAIFDNIKTGKDLLIDRVASHEISRIGLLEDGPCRPIYTSSCFSSKIARESKFFTARRTS